MRVVRAILDESVGMVQLLVGRDYLNYEAMKDHHDNDIGFISLFYDYETVGEDILESHQYRSRQTISSQ